MGGLEYKFNTDIEAIKVNPLLGDNSATLMAITVGVIALLTIAALIVFMRGFGIISAISIVAFLFTLTAMLVAVPGIVLSTPGVLGMIVALVFTAVGVFATGKRIGEAYAKGKTIKSAVKAGFNGVFKSLLNALVVLAAVSLSVFFLTTGTLQCFGIVLGIGSAVSFLATVLLSRLLTSCFIPLCNNPEGFFNLKREDE
jgi:preprotein translocase subunit SecD